MTPLEERLQQALTARAELITHETVSSARPPAPARTRPGRVVMTATVLAAAAAVAILATVAFSSLGRPASFVNPAGSGGPDVALGTTATISTRPTTATTPASTQAAASPIGTTTSQPSPSVSRHPVTPEHGTETEAVLAASVQMRPAKLPAGSIASFRGVCPDPEQGGTVGSKAFLTDDDHEVNGIGAQTFTIDANGTFAGSIAVRPDVTPAVYEVSLWCGSTDGKPTEQTELTVLEAQAPGTDQDIRLAAHAVYPGEWIAFSGVCAGGTMPNSGWVISPAFEQVTGHEYAGVGAAPFTTDAEGTFVGTAHIPEDRKAGEYTVTVRCNGGTLAKTEALAILAR